MRSQASTGRMGWENGQRVPVRDAREMDENPRPERGALVMARKLICVILADTNPALGVECMALVTGIGYEGSSMADIARRHAVTRAAVSKRCVDLCDSFGIPPVRAQRDLANREKTEAARREVCKEMKDPANHPYRGNHSVKIRQRKNVPSR